MEARVKKQKIAIPRDGYTEKPQAGREIVIAAAVWGLLITLLPMISALSLGPDKVKAIWDAGWQPGNNSTPVMDVDNILCIGGMILVFWHSATSKGWKRALCAFLLAGGIGLTVEILACNFGLWYGPLQYSTNLPLQIFGVPLILGPFWEVYGYPAFFLTCYLLPAEFIHKKKKTLGSKILSTALISCVGAWVCMATDFMSDPWNIGYKVFSWRVDGPVWPQIDSLGGIGEPLSNFTGWFMTCFLIMTVYQLLINTAPADKHVRSKYLDVYFPIVMYASTFGFLMSIEIFWQRQWMVVLIGSMLIGGILLFALIKLWGERSNGYAYDFLLKPAEIADVEAATVNKAQRAAPARIQEDTERDFPLQPKSANRKGFTHGKRRSKAALGIGVVLLLSLVMVTTVGCSSATGRDLPVRAEVLGVLKDANFCFDEYTISTNYGASEDQVIAKARMGYRYPNNKLLTNGMSITPITQVIVNKVNGIWQVDLNSMKPEPQIWWYGPTE